MRRAIPRCGVRALELRLRNSTGSDYDAFNVRKVGRFVSLLTDDARESRRSSCALNSPRRNVRAPIAPDAGYVPSGQVEPCCEVTSGTRGGRRGIDMGAKVTARRRSESEHPHRQETALVDSGYGSAKSTSSSHEPDYATNAAMSGAGEDAGAGVGAGFPSRRVRINGRTSIISSNGACKDSPRSPPPPPLDGGRTEFPFDTIPPSTEQRAAPCDIVSEEIDRHIDSVIDDFIRDGNVIRLPQYSRAEHNTLMKNLPYPYQQRSTGSGKDSAEVVVARIAKSSNLPTYREHVELGQKSTALSRVPVFKIVDYEIKDRVGPTEKCVTTKVPRVKSSLIRRSLLKRPVSICNNGTGAKETQIKAGDCDTLVDKRESKVELDKELQHISNLKYITQSRSNVLSKKLRIPKLNSKSKLKITKNEKSATTLNVSYQNDISNEGIQLISITSKNKENNTKSVKESKIQKSENTLYKKPQTIKINENKIKELNEINCKTTNNEIPIDNNNKSNLSPLDRNNKTSKIAKMSNSIYSKKIINRTTSIPCSTDKDCKTVKLQIVENKEKINNNISDNKNIQSKYRNIRNSVNKLTKSIEVVHSVIPEEFKSSPPSVSTDKPEADTPTVTNSTPKSIAKGSIPRPLPKLAASAKEDETKPTKRVIDRSKVRDNNTPATGTAVNNKYNTVRPFVTNTQGALKYGSPDKKAISATKTSIVRQPIKSTRVNKSARKISCPTSPPPPPPNSQPQPLVSGKAIKASPANDRITQRKNIAAARRIGADPKIESKIQSSTRKPKVVATVANPNRSDDVANPNRADTCSNPTRQRYMTRLYDRNEPTHRGDKPAPCRQTNNVKQKLTLRSTRRHTLERTAISLTRQYGVDPKSVNAATSRYLHPVVRRKSEAVERGDEMIRSTGSERSPSQVIIIQLPYRVTR